MTTLAEPAAPATEDEAAAAKPRFRLRSRRDRLITIGSVIVLLGIWEVAARQVDPILAAPPSAVLKALVTMAEEGSLHTAVLQSAKPFLSGYLLAIVVGVPLGLLIGRFRAVEAALGWLIIAGYAMPMIALIPVFVLWFGLGFAVKMAMVMVMTVFAIVINTWNGVQNVPRATIEVGMAFNASQARILRQIVVPSVIPSIMTGLRIGIGKAVVGIVIAEFFTALGGIGGVIVEAGHSFQPDRMFAAVVVLMAAAVVLTWLIGIAERRLAPWNRSITGSGQ
ncbi:MULTISPECIES: ABC transporter permease [Actinomadura]|jgi:NitT/TauT family transport system permease protein|uniref:ABC transporter permease n=1 Tax=Actinomadura geliboluensis TaxID=882440 RepID=A0A5S4H8Q0_9ACTN|nr:ABC transporter permease [Actinomadura geliboluensis]TMR41151.1 ABC transporter permease [Actinomadura geliboluensis]